MLRVVELSGGVGGARLARGLSQIPGIDLTIVVNVGDDDVIHGLHVSPDLDTVVYTMAGLEGTQGWGRADDSFVTNTELERFGVDNRFQLGDKDVAINILRTAALRSGVSLSKFTSEIVDRLGIGCAVIPVTDDSLRTLVQIESGEVLSFQDYFVIRQHRETVVGLEFTGSATPAPGVVEAIREADTVIIGPSNPPLSIWPILSVQGVREEVRRHPNVVAISPLFGGKALKGPADRVMRSLGLSPGTRGVLEAYEGLIDRLIIDVADASDPASHSGSVAVEPHDTRIVEAAAARRLGEEILRG
ncbi:MAG: 2-phospho-L-lactate transferase [Actinobacteria bacterium]|nr:MAG: 2-phospho-L-lactate transferase [Actinomycetota bacterium]